MSKSVSIRKEVRNLFGIDKTRKLVMLSFYLDL